MSDKQISLAKEIEKALKLKSENKYSMFDILSSIDMTCCISKKATGGSKELSYIAWMDSWAVLKKLYPQARKEIVFFDHHVVNGDFHYVEKKPYFFDPILGFMVETKIIIDETIESCQLPVMDGANNSMNSVSYEYTTKYGTKTVAKATMHDINTAHMRCLAKTIAQCGLACNIYAGDDLPMTIIDEELAPQYIKDEVVSLRNEVSARLEIVKHITAEEKERKIQSKQYKDVMALKPTDKLKKQFESGGCNIEYTKHLINMAIALDIDVGQFIKTTPEVK